MNIKGRLNPLVTMFSLHSGDIPPKKNSMSKQALWYFFPKTEKTAEKLSSVFPWMGVCLGGAQRVCACQRKYQDVPRNLLSETRYRYNNNVNQNGSCPVFINFLMIFLTLPGEVRFIDMPVLEPISTAITSSGFFAEMEPQSAGISLGVQSIRPPKLLDNSRRQILNRNFVYQGKVCFVNEIHEDL